MTSPLTHTGARTLEDLARELCLAVALVNEMDKALCVRRCGLDLDDTHLKVHSAIETAATYLEDALARVGKVAREAAENAPRSADIIAWNRQTRPNMGPL